MKYPIAILLVLMFSAGCGAQPPPDPAADAATAAGVNGGTQTTRSDQRPLLVVHKTPWCGCCTAWAEQAAEAGFRVEMRDTDDLAPIKQALGVPGALASCHTTEVEGYFVEGHVPFEQVRRLLAERPDARGIAVPGMPLGSPGMEADIHHDYRVYRVGDDGRVDEYAHYPAR